MCIFAWTDPSSGCEGDSDWVRTNEIVTIDGVSRGLAARESEIIIMRKERDAG